MINSSLINMRTEVLNIAIIYIDVITLLSGHINIIYLLPICISNISVSNNVIKYA